MKSQAKDVSSNSRITARKRLVSTLSEEILNRAEREAYLMPSEHTLCRRFHLSRVTVRLALADLETKGLIYRQHGRGTFAHGRGQGAQKGLAILLKGVEAMKCWPLSELMRGMQSHSSQRHAPITFLDSSLKENTSELLSSLAGVLVFPDAVADEDLEILRNRKLPYLFATKTSLSGPRITLGEVDAARIMTERLLLLGHQRLGLMVGYHPSLDALKREGIDQAVRSVGLAGGAITEITIPNGEEAGLAAIDAALQANPHPSAWIAFDDSFAAMLIFCARRLGLQVPRDISIVSFHDLPYFRYLEPALSTVGFDFFEAGKLAAKSLYHSFLTGEEVQDIFLEPKYRAGKTMAQYFVKRENSDTAAAA